MSKKYDTEPKTGLAESNAILGRIDAKLGTMNQRLLAYEAWLDSINERLGQIDQITAVRSGQ